MSSFFDNGPLPDWKDLQKWLGKDIPWKLAENWDRKRESGWLDQYVQKMLQGAKSEAGIQSKNFVRTETRHDAKSVIVTIRLAPETDMHNLQLFATADRLKILGLPDDQKCSVRFPCLVYARSGKVSMAKDRVLVARFKRRPSEKSEYELFIRT
ncbi:hypothetical protein D7Z26_04230 [Cohnella endophytica]|uniref:Uncharacterized protein n=1 Tax=Cohnella endophytica TaxID=2419778 RepID=A0A494Y384_9BACL|nr:hypothetical protein [Cohnella endophytica]RKP57197.1 hypothetical protein D7Z26_04230 [Cohnella endophytica]